MSKEIEFDMVTTRGGDSGKSSLYSGEFLWKDHIIFEVLGELDSLSAEIGYDTPKPLDETLAHIQDDLYRIMAIIATNSKSEVYIAVTKTEIPVNYLEQLQHRLMKKLKLGSQFVRPTGRLDILRTQARRAERALVRYIRTPSKPIDVDYHDLKECQKYLNRLSDLFFVMARWVEKG